MAESPHVSVVMSVYNADPGLLESAVNSILNQSYSDFEFIIVDDGSKTPVSETLTHSEDPRIVLLRHNANRGLGHSLNEGCKAARGALIARQDADDASHPERLARQVAFMNEHPRTGLLGTAFAVMNGRRKRLTVVCLGSENAELKQKLSTMNCFCHGAVMMRREALEAVGGYRELDTCQDYDLWLRIAERYEIANLPEALYDWHLSDSAVSVHRARKQAEHLSLVRQWAQERSQSGRDSFPEYAAGGNPRAGVQHYWGVPMKGEAEALLLQSSRFWMYGDPLGAIRSGLRGLASDPWNRHVWGVLLGRPSKKFLRHFGRRVASVR